MNIHLLESREEIREILTNGRYTTLALNDGNDSYILTMHYGLHRKEDILFFECYGNGTKMDFFRSNPYISGTVIAESPDGTVSSVVYSGLLEVIHNPAEQEEARSSIKTGGLSPSGKPYTALEYSTDRILVMKLTMEELSGKVIPAF
ncbi:MAG: pyridoxamine 5'-phosphate oxidase family protein [Spirochaetales bacterium]|nr:pyridoxamine 5'-phosphate oxidase family protein [Spirochaetales bacterium]